MNRNLFRFGVILALFLGLALSVRAQCPANAQYIGELNGEGSFNNNLNSTPNVVFPANIKLDPNYKQTTLKAFGGGSDSRSTMQASEVPAGICIAPHGTEDHDKGWAVHSPSFQPATWDGYTIKQFKFALTLYCTTGSGAVDATTGGCNVKVPVYAVVVKPAATKGKKKSS